MSNEYLMKTKNKPPRRTDPRNIRIFTCSSRATLSFSSLRFFPGSRHFLQGESFIVVLKPCTTQPLGTLRT